MWCEEIPGALIYYSAHACRYLLLGETTMSKFGEALRGLTVFISDIRNCKLLVSHQ